MRTSDFDYELPPGAIAKHPLPRGSSRLLRLPAEGAAEHHRFADLPRLLRPGDLLVVNDTKVLPARLEARRATGGGVEILLLERQRGRQWTALLRPAKRLRQGETLSLADLEVEIVEKRLEGEALLRFSAPISERLHELGAMPLPPYLERPAQASDELDYQTIYARRPGAVAAPTAGLHFTPEMLAVLAARGIEHCALTLHVGAGTFRPVESEAVESHRMHSERFALGATTAERIGACRRAGGRIVAVGTTVVRALESVAAERGELTSAAGRTSLYITPGFEFRVVDLMVTNFHLPRSTLLVMVAAFAGRKRILDAYRQAITAGYRFYSYGDATLIERAAPRHD